MLPAGPGVERLHRREKTSCEIIQSLRALRRSYLRLVEPGSAAVKAGATDLRVALAPQAVPAGRAVPAEESLATFRAQ